MDGLGAEVCEAGAAVLPKDRPGNCKFCLDDQSRRLPLAPGRPVAYRLSLLVVCATGGTDDE